MLLGVNLAVAAVFMQGCKATKPQGAPPPPAKETARPPAQQATQTAVQRDIETVHHTRPSATDASAKSQHPSPSTAVKPKDDKPLPPPEPEYTEYTVKKGDILSRICVKNGVRQRDVLKLNPSLNPDMLFVGKKIRLPISASQPAVVKTTAASQKKGSVKHASANNVKGASPSAANVTPPVTKKSSYKPYTGPTKEYVVKSGDQVGKIAYSYGITARALKELNGLPDSNLRIGQKLKVPAEKVKAEEKKTVPAKDVKTEAKEDANKGAETVTPAPEPAPNGNEAPAPDPNANGAAPTPDPNANTVTPAPEPAPEPAPAPMTYKVKKGEDIVAIAITFGVSPSALLDINDLKTGDTVVEGQELKLPPGAKLQ